MISFLASLRGRIFSASIFAVRSSVEFKCTNREREIVRVVGTLFATLVRESFVTLLGGFQYSLSFLFPSLRVTIIPELSIVSGRSKGIYLSLLGENQKLRASCSSVVKSLTVPGRFDYPRGLTLPGQRQLGLGRRINFVGK